MKNGIIQMRSVKEMLRVIGLKEEERKHAKKKLECELDFVDLEAKNSFQANKVSTSIVKYAHRYNYYQLRHSITNSNLIEANCLRCNHVETWDYVVEYRDTVNLRREFMTELSLELLAEKNDKVSVDNVKTFGKDIMRCLECEEDEVECKTS